ncbi:hypothetical protein RhiJN_25833 [Ceratobasidium sp. AG-Ba]|nr:hypothetical protein RhiJN_25833 [Ceratobasidium sp. AG-Ba]
MDSRAFDCGWRPMANDEEWLTWLNLRSSKRWLVTFTPPSTHIGTKRGNAALDTPPPGEEESSLIVEGPRSQKPTSKISQYNEERTSARSQSATREYDKAFRDDQAAVDRRSSQSSTRGANPPPKTRGRNPAPKAHHGGGPPNAKKHRSVSRPKGRVRVRDVPEEEAEERLRMRWDLRDIPRSPTPGSTDHEENEDGDQEAGQQTEVQPSESEYTFVEETAGYETLAAFAADRLGQDFNGRGDEDIQMALDIAQDQADEVRAPQPETEIVMLETSGSHVSRGWINQASTTLATNLGKRPAEYQSSTSTVKRIRTSNPNDSATEPESDDEPTTAANQSDPPPHPPPPPPPLLHQEDSRPPIAPLEHMDTAPTTLGVPLEGQPQPTPPSLSSHSTCFPALSNIHSEDVPTRGPVHARMKKKLAARECEREMAKRRVPSAPENQGSEQEGTSPPPPSSPPNSAPLPSLANNVRPTDTSAPRVQRIYGRDRTNAGPGDEGPTPDRPNSPTVDDVRASRSARSVLDMLEDEPCFRTGLPTKASMKAARAELRARARLFGQYTEPTSLPKTTFRRPAPAFGRTDEQPSGRGTASYKSGSHRQSQSQPQSQSQSQRQQPQPQSRQPQPRSQHKQQRSRLDPVAAAKADLAAFNKRYNDADVSHAEALQEGKQPTGGRKKKPLARNVHGHRRQVLTYAKLHLFAYILVEGAYQTRGVYIIWAARVHEATWLAMFPDLPYRAATADELEIMVNYIATLRGKVKEKIQAIVEIVYEFDGRVVTQDDIWANLDRFNEIHPNTFHCTSYRPRRGHYESEHITRCIAAALFQGPNSVGVLYPDYFEDMPLTVIAFILAMMQYCIEEWQTRYFVNGDLGAAKMLDKYESHLAGLKGLQAVAPRRTAKLQQGWANYAFDYCGASFVDERKNREEAVFHSEFRPDTPPLEDPSESSRTGSLHALAPESSQVLPEDGEERMYSPVHGSPIERTRSPNPFLELRADTPYEDDSGKHDV